MEFYEKTPSWAQFQLTSSLGHISVVSQTTSLISWNTGVGHCQLSLLAPPSTKPEHSPKQIQIKSATKGLAFREFRVNTFSKMTHHEANLVRHNTSACSAAAMINQTKPNLHGDSRQAYVHFYSCEFQQETSPKKLQGGEKANQYFW